MNGQIETRANRRPLVLIGLLFVVLLAVFQDASSNDLRSLWLAGKFFDQGASGVYSGSTGVFTMEPPAQWIEDANTDDVSRPVYPFIYPPLWAWLVEPLTDLMTFATFKLIASTANAALICGSLFLACRIAAPRGTELLYVAAGMLICLSSIVVLLPLAENQPQILVSFLILLGIERERAGHQVVGGIAMAVAASIKLYPALFAIFWLCGGRRPAFASFAIFGALLGLFSIFVAGWPLHRAFLHEISIISGTILFSIANFSLDPLVAFLFVGESGMTLVTSEITGGKTSWLIYQKPLPGSSQAFARS